MNLKVSVFYLFDHDEFCHALEQVDEMTCKSGKSVLLAPKSGPPENPLIGSVKVDKKSINGLIRSKKRQKWTNEVHLSD